MTNGLVRGSPRAFGVVLGIVLGSTTVLAQSPSYTFLTLAGAPPGAPFGWSHALTVDASGTIYVYDTQSVIRKVTPSGQVSNLAGQIDTPGSTDGVGTNARFSLDGIGSRDFIVLNAGGSAVAPDAAMRIVGDAAAVTSRPAGTGEVWGRAGFDPVAQWETIEPDNAGTRTVRIPQMGRLELWLGANVTTGYVAVNGTLRPLPAGSQLRDGVFTWAPPVAYFGAYDLVFLNGLERVPVTVTIQGARESRIEGYIDAPTTDATVRGAFAVAGWAADPSAWNGTGIGAVHVWATPTCDGRRARGDVLDVRRAMGDVRDVRRATCGVPRFIGVAELGLWRPDVAAQLGAQFERAGWSLTAPALPPGEYDIVAYFWSAKTQQFEDARGVRVVVR